MELVTIELRPLIQSCNVFIYLEEEIESRLIRVSPSRNSIKVELGESVNTINVGTINIIPTSISNLNIFDKWIIFRLQTSPPNSSTGNFHSEVLNSIDHTDQECPEGSENIIVPEKDVPTSLLCFFCGQTISLPDIVFHRIMTLPSTDSDPSEWFCCGGCNYRPLLQPRLTDFFYSSHFCILNKGIFSNNVGFLRNDVVCSRCRKILGTSNDEQSLKIWNHAIKYRLPPGVNVDATTPLEDFKLALRKCANKGAVYDILFMAIEEDKHYYLSIKILDKKLSLLLESSIELGNVATVGKTVLKVLYRCLITAAPDLKDLTGAHVCQMSYLSMTEGLEYLRSTTKRIPPLYNLINGCRVGYII